MPDPIDAEFDPAPLQWLRWGLATLIVAAWLALFMYWLISGDHPACQVTTVTHGGHTASVTRSCGLPDATDYIFVLGLVVMLLLPDAASVTLGVFTFERRGRLLRRAGKVATAAFAGDTLKNAEPASEVLGRLVLAAAAGDTPEAVRDARPADEALGALLEPGAGPGQDDDA